MKTAVFIILLFIPRPSGCLKLDVILVVDTSASVFNSQRFINDAISTFRQRFVGTDVNVGIVTFNERAEIRCHLGDTTTVSVFPCCSTNLLEGLRKATDELFGPYGRQDYRKMIVIISDGEVDYPDSCIRMLTFMKSTGIGILGVQVGKVNTFMRDNCDVYVESDYEQLAEELKRMDVCI